MYFVLHGFFRPFHPITPWPYGKIRYASRAVRRRRRKTDGDEKVTHLGVSHIPYIAQAKQVKYTKGNMYCWQCAVQCSAPYRGFGRVLT